MTSRVGGSWLALLVGLLLGSCHTTDRAFDPIGRWSSKDGYEITLKNDGTYEFCDRGSCSQGKAERPGGRFGVTLVGVLKKENAGRLAQELRRLYAGYPDNFRSDG